MEEAIQTQEINITEIILETINSLCQSLFSSIDNAIFPLLDDLIFIDSNITETSYLERIMGQNVNTGLLVLANALLLAFVLYYAIRRFTAFFNGQEVESPYKFVVRAIFICILMNFSLSICSGIVSFSHEITDFICGLGNNIFKKEMSFSSLINELSGKQTSAFNIFSIDGILTSMLSISSFSLVINFTFRYILTKVLILLSPFAFLCLLNQTTKGFFHSWYKSFLSLLLVQIIVALILLLPFAILKEASSTIFSKLLLIGSVYALLKANQFVKEFINGTGISTDFNSGVSRNKIFIYEITYYSLLFERSFNGKIYISNEL